MAIACAGYRIVSKVGNHRVSLESTKLVLGKAAHKYADYFEPCRRKRNTIDYTFSNVATDTEAKEILVQAKQFYVEVEDWITKNHRVAHLKRVATLDYAFLAEVRCANPTTRAYPTLDRQHAFRSKLNLPPHTPTITVAA